MPHQVDFSKITNIKTLEVNPKGWINPLFVEYGLGLHYNTPSYFWKIKGTNHTFVIPISRLEFLSSGEYKSHFEEVLEGFREDYVEWKKENFNIDWMKEYEKEYSKIIL